LLPVGSPPLGRSSFALVAGFVLFMCLLFTTVWLYGGGNEVRRLSMEAGGRFFSWSPPNLILAPTLLAALASAVAAGAVALAAIIRKVERSILMLVPLAVAGIALVFAIGELFESSR
jgi:hypothetical protein